MTSIRTGLACQLVKMIMLAKLVKMFNLSVLEKVYVPPALVIGWGTTAEGGPQSSVLQEVELTVVDDQTCSKAMAEGERWDDISNIVQLLTQRNIIGRFFQMNKFVQVVTRGRMRVRCFSFLFLINEIP